MTGGGIGARSSRGFAFLSNGSIFFRARGGDVKQLRSYYVQEAMGARYPRRLVRHRYPRDHSSTRTARQYSSWSRTDQSALAIVAVQLFDIASALAEEDA